MSILQPYRLLLQRSGDVVRGAVDSYRGLKSPITPSRLRALSAENREKLIDDYREYIDSVSTSEMAASVEALSVAVAFADIKLAQGIADLGSGFSSYAFRRLLPHAQVRSFDDNSDWLTKSNEFVSHALDVQSESGGGFHQFDSVADVEKWGPFDFIFYDLGSMEQRHASLDGIVDLAHSWGSFLFVDDIHKSGFRDRVDECARAHGVIMRSLRTLTLDSHARYSGFCDFCAYA